MFAIPWRGKRHNSIESTTDRTEAVTQFSVSSQSPPRKESGLGIMARGAPSDAGFLLKDLELAPGSVAVLFGSNGFAKQFYCDWILGYANVPNTEVRFGNVTDQRADLAAVLGRMPMLFGDGLLTALLHKTSLRSSHGKDAVTKQELMDVFINGAGVELRARGSVLSPFLDRSGEPISTRTMSSKEIMEVSEMNAILRKSPVLVLDATSSLFEEAVLMGYRPNPALWASGRTVIVIAKDHDQLGSLKCLYAWPLKNVNAIEI